MANDEWITPAAIIEAARDAMGGIDLDPASSERANEWVRAERFLCQADDGLLQTWHGRIWLNPPYSRGNFDRFIDKLLFEWRVGRVKQACVLTNLVTDTRAGQRLLRNATATCMLAGRLRFIEPEGGKVLGSPPIGQMVQYFGPDAAPFVDAFESRGVVLIHTVNSVNTR